MAIANVNLFLSIIYVFPLNLPTHFEYFSPSGSTMLHQRKDGTWVSKASGRWTIEDGARSILDLLMDHTGQKGM